MTNRASTLIAGRRGRMSTALGRPLPSPMGVGADPVSDADREHLISSAADLYWNELEWENLTEEERTDGGNLTELAFGSFLAFVRGLLLAKVMPDSLAPAEPRPEVVEDLLSFLAEQVIALQDRLEGEGDEDPARTRGELAMTDTLVDLVLLSLHGVDPGDVEGFREVTAH